MNKKEAAFYIVFIIIIVSAFFLRFYMLDERVFHHDEAAVGYFTYKLFSDHTYSYDPAFHGPFMYYATTEIFKAVGDTEYSARILPAILGSAMLLFLFPLRKYIGNTGTLVSAFFIAFSPSFLYYSRFYREDIFMSFFSLLLLVCAVKFVENHSNEINISIKNRYLFLSMAIILTTGFIWIIPFVYLKLVSLLTLKGLQFLSIVLISFLILILGFSRYPLMRLFYIGTGTLALASLVALKENAYIMIAFIFFFMFLLILKNKWYAGILSKIKRLDKEILIIITELLIFVLLFLVFFSLYYTGNFLDINGMKYAIMKAVSHWYEMHRIERMAGPFYFYLPILALYELPILVFGVLGIARYGCCDRKKEKMLAVILVYWVILDIMYYIRDMYPGTGKFLPVSYVPDSMIIFLPLLVFAVITVLRTENIFMSFLIYWALANFLVYSYVQEKVPWLVLNPLLPLTMIAAMYLRGIPGAFKSGSRKGMIIVSLIIVMSLFFVYSSFQLNYYRYTDPAEPLIQAAQPPQKFSMILDTINEVSIQIDGNSTEIQIADAELETLFLWYLRYYDNIRWRVDVNSTFNAPFIVVHDTDGNESEADIVKRGLRTDYERLDSARMSWYWFKPSDITPDYLLYRKMDRYPSEYRIVLYYKPKSE